MKKIKLIRVVILFAIIVTLITVFSNIFLNTNNERNTSTVDEIQLNNVDSTIKIVGNLEYKLIFRQTGYNENNLTICLPFDKISKTDSTLFLSITGDDKKITKFNITYDNCTLNAFDEWFIKSWKYTEACGENTYIIRQDSAALHQWVLNIEKTDIHCDDTDYNKVKIGKDDSNYIKFSRLHNVIIEELDINNDGFTEIYLFSYIWCMCEIDVYRVNVI